MYLGLLFTGLESSNKENVNGVSGIKERTVIARAQSVQRLATGRTGRGLNPGRGQEMFCSSYPSRPFLPITQVPIQWEPKIFPWGKAAEAWLCVHPVECYGVTFTTIMIIPAILGQ